MQSNFLISNLFNGVKKRLISYVSNNDKKAGLNWLKVKYLKHAPIGIKKSFRHNDHFIYYSQPSELLHTLREIFGAEIYKVSLPSNPYIIDCGANIGLSVIYFKEHFPTAEIVAFEPDENNFKLLDENVRSFGFSKVSLRKEAVWIENTTLSFSSDGCMSSKINLSQTSSTIKVKAIRLKDLLNRHVDFLKIDIEGAEYELLKDIKNELANVDYLFLEYHGDFSQNNELTDIFNIVKDAGFNYYIKEAAEIYVSPFLAATSNKTTDFDVQLNIFCFRKK